jgi:hypothetical protein
MEITGWYQNDFNVDGSANQCGRVRRRRPDTASKDRSENTGLAQFFCLKILIRAVELAHNLGQPCIIFVKDCFRAHQRRWALVLAPSCKLIPMRVYTLQYFRQSTNV